MIMSVILGWDVGQAVDASIVGVVSYDGNPAQFWVRRIVRLHRGMPYPEQVRMVKDLYLQYHSPQLILDRTGIGRAIGDLIQEEGLQPVMISLTAGDKMSRPEPGCINLPKQDMIASFTRAMQECRLRVVPGCENAALFRTELKAFQLKVSASGHNTYNAAPGSHDDTITAIGLAIWYADGRRGRPEGAIRAWCGDARW